MTLTVPSTKYTIAPNPTIPSGTATITVGMDGRQTLSVTGVNLILNKPYTITMSVSVACDGATGSWESTAKLFGGSTMFTLNNPGNAQKTTVSGSCPPDSITFFQGPATSTAAGTNMAPVIVKVSIGASAANNIPVRLESDGLAMSPTGWKNTGTDGMVTFSGAELKVVNAVGSSYTMIATTGTLTTAPATFAVVAGPPFSVTFIEQPSDTQFSEVINGATGVQVRVADEVGNALSDVSVKMSIAPGFNPPGNATLGGTTTEMTVDGIAIFDDLVITKSSSGYRLLAKVGTIETLSETLGPPSDPDPAFAITSTPPAGCTDPSCTVPIDTDSTVTVPEGTTLIVETNQLNCAGFLTNPIAGTVTIIPDPNSVGGVPDHLRRRDQLSHHRRLPILQDAESRDCGSRAGSVL